MPSKIWNKYKLIEEIDSKSNIKTYLTRLEPIIKEIIPKDKDEYYTIYERLEKLKEQLDIYEIIEENERFYIVIDNNDETSSKIDKLLLSDELDIKKEGILYGQGNPITKEEIFDLFKMENAMCKILNYNKFKGSGFFCEIDNFNFPFKYALFTNNHVLNEYNIKIGNTIDLKYLDIKKQIEITENRKTFTNEELDYTCIELFESDDINDYFKIDPKIFKYDKNLLKNKDIFILQFPIGNDLSFSYGKILSLKYNKIIHSASTDIGSSGSPIIRRCMNNYIIGLHFGGIPNNKNEYKYNLANTFDSILNNIKQQYFNEIIGVYYPCEYGRDCLLHDYDSDDDFDYEKNEEKLYLESKNINKKLFEENIDLYINQKKVQFNFKYKFREPREISVKFKFKKVIINARFMFLCCMNLKSIDLSSFNTINVNDMSYMFTDCSSLESINLSSINTINVKNMSCMFAGCSSLKSINLSSFNTINVNDMCCMFDMCRSLESIDLSSFNTNNVQDMSGMFCQCSSLKSINLSSFNTTNVKNMSYMFSECSILKSINLSSFITNNVNDMSVMFYNCTSLESIDLSSFDTFNVNNMEEIFSNCSSLKKENIKIKNKKDKILDKI